MAPGDIFLANFPFGAGSGSKLRPVLLLTGPMGSVPELLVAYISSEIPTTLLETDILLDPSAPQNSTTKLKSTSVLRLHKLATIHRRSLIRALGALPTPVFDDAKLRLKNMLQL